MIASPPVVAQLSKPMTMPATPVVRNPLPASPPTQVLVVDDEEPLRRLLRVSLQGAGYKVTTAGNGQEALRLFNDAPFDIVLVDVMMPDMDGHTLCQEFRKVSNVPIIMISAMNRTEAILAGFAAGADDYINKPFQLREVDLRIKALLRCIARWQAAYALEAA